MKETEVSAPSWGDDELSAFFVQARNNAVSVFVHGDQLWRSLREIHRRFVQVGAAPVDSADEWLQALVVGRAMSAFLGSVRMGASGQLSEAFTLIRSVIEWGAYSCLLLSDPVTLRAWLDRDSSDAARKAARGKVTWQSASEAIPDVGLRTRMRHLYDQSITLGAHPNPAAAIRGIRIGTDTSTGGATMTVISLHEEPPLTDSVLRCVAEAAITSLETLRVGCRSSFNKAGIRPEILAGLRRRLEAAKPYDAPFNRREQDDQTARLVTQFTDQLKR